MSTYTPRPYVRPAYEPGNQRLGDLLRMRGRNLAEHEYARGDASARMWQNVGNTISNTVQGVTQALEQQKVQKAEETQKAQLSRQDSAFIALLQEDPNPDPRKVIAIYGPQRGMAVAQGVVAFNALQSGKVKDARETAGRLAMGMKASSPAVQTAFWPSIRDAAIKGGLGTPEEIPEQSSPEYLDAIIGWATGKEPVKPVEPSLIQRDPTRDLVHPTTGAVVTKGTPAAERPGNPTEASLAMAAAGGDENALKALRLLRIQNASQAQPDTEWVTRDGRPAQIRKGTAQAGDVPYSPPKSTSETAQDRQRKGRLESAKGFLTRLNELRGTINTKIGPEAGLTGMVRQGKAAIGLDPDVAEYERVRAAGGRALAVAIMGAQNLSDADAAAWSNMLPGARIDKVTAKRLTDQITRMLEDTDPGSTKAGAVDDDPLGLFK